MTNKPKTYVVNLDDIASIVIRSITKDLKEQFGIVADLSVILESESGRSLIEIILQNKLMRKIKSINEDFTRLNRNAGFKNSMMHSATMATLYSRLFNAASSTHETITDIIDRMVKEILPSNAYYNLKDGMHNGFTLDDFYDNIDLESSPLWQETNLGLIPENNQWAVVEARIVNDAIHIQDTGDYRILAWTLLNKTMG